MVKNKAMPVSIQRVKEILNDQSISDQEVEKIRDCFDALVRDVIFEAWLEDRNKNKQKHDYKNIK